MAIGGQNQTNRLGHGVASKTETYAGQVEWLAQGEKSLGEVIGAVVSANSRGPGFAPFEVRLLSEVAAEVRTKTTVAGFDISLVVAGNPAQPTVIYPSQNSESPKDDILIYLSGAGKLHVLLLG